MKHTLTTQDGEVGFTRERTEAASLGVVILTTETLAATTLDVWLRANGHRPLAVVSARDGKRALTDPLPEWAYGMIQLVEQAPSKLDVLVASHRSHLAPLVGLYEPDLVVSFGFPWRVPPEVLALPRLGAINIHPSVLPKYRGPNPIGWTFRNGDPEMGISFHRMDADFDTGALLAQGTTPLGDDDDIDTVGDRLIPLLWKTLPIAMGRLARAEFGEPQTTEGLSRAGRFEDEFVEIDWRRSARHIHNQVRSWRFAASVSGRFGALSTLDGARRRVIKSRLSSEEVTTGEPGAIVAREDNRLLIRCGDGCLWVLQSIPA